MGHDSIQHLLRAVDEASPLPRVDADQLARGARRAAGRQRAREAGKLLVLPLMVIGITMLIDRYKEKPTQPAAPALAANADLSERIAAEMRVVDEMSAADRLVAAQNRIRRLAGEEIPLARISQQREQTALTLLHGAAIGSSADDAAKVYREVMTLFPQTSAARVARNRLSELQ